MSLDQDGELECLQIISELQLSSQKATRPSDWPSAFVQCEDFTVHHRTNFLLLSCFMHVDGVHTSWGLHLTRLRVTPRWPLDKKP